MTIRKSSLPTQSVLNASTRSFNYVDSFQGEFDSNGSKPISSAALGKLFFMSGPAWVENLFAFRNRLARWVGLKTPNKTSDRQRMLDNFKCEVGEQMGLFRVFYSTEQEVVLGEDDKHLDFRVSLYLDRNSRNGRQLINISTTVYFNHWLGRAYFLPVKLFHRLIVPGMLKSIIKNIEKEDNPSLLNSASNNLTD